MFKSLKISYYQSKILEQEYAVNYSTLPYSSETCRWQILLLSV